MGTVRSAFQARRNVQATDVRCRRLEVRPLLALVAAAALLAGCTGASAPTLTPTPTPSLAPTASGDAIVASFISLTQAPDRSAHFEADGIVRSAGADMALTSAYDLHGDDYRGTSTVEAPAFGTMSVTTAVVDGVGYTRSGDGDWTGAQTPSPPQDPLRGLSVADLEYAGQLEVGGQAGHRLVVRDPVEAFTRAMGVTLPQGVGAISPSDASFEVRVDADGRPASATLLLRGTTTTVGGIEVDIRYTFTAWGAVGPIDPPITMPPTAAPGDVLTVHNRITSDILLRDGNGAQLPVPACGSASAATFDVSRFDVLLASSGEILYAEYPVEGSYVTSVVIVGADIYQTQPGAYDGELPPCLDRRVG